MILMTVLLPLMLGAEGAAGGSASIVLSGGEPGALAAGSYSLVYETAFVAQGSYSGLRVAFKAPAGGEDYHELELFIPSHGEFSVGYDSGMGEFISRIPEIPFTFRPEQTADVTDRRGRPRSMRVKLTHWRRTGKQSWSPLTADFTDCEIQVESMAVEENRLSFSGGFECRSEEPELAASGSFTVAAAELGVSKVD